MKKILVTRPDFSSVIMRQLQRKFDLAICSCTPDTQKETFINNIRGAEGIFCTAYDFIDKDVLNAAGPQLKVISTASFSYDHIDIEECKNRKITVTNVPFIGSNGVAELAMGLLLVAARKIFEASTAIRWNKRIHNESVQYYCGKKLKNSFVGIAGMDNVGLEIITRIIPFETSAIYYYDEVGRNDEAEKLGVNYFPFEELLKKSDFVIGNFELSENTREIFNARAFDMMKADAIFVNVGRSETVQYDDLFDVLKNKKIRGAGVDVMHPVILKGHENLFTLPNIVITANLSFNDVRNQFDRQEHNAKNFETVLEGGIPESRIC